MPWADSSSLRLGSASPACCSGAGRSSPSSTRRDRPSGVISLILSAMSRPLVIAHRCGPLDAEPPAAENSISGMLTSLALGADAIEIDVRLSLNGTPVLMHDITARRTAGFPVPVRLLSEAQLNRTRLFAAKEPIPTLAAMLEAVPAGVLIVADVKDPRVMWATIEITRASGRLADTVFWCRQPKAVRQAA